MKSEDDAVAVLKHSVLRQYNWGNVIITTVMEESLTLKAV